MAGTVAIGKQAFDEVIENDCFYVDKTGFIKEWWENKDNVTLITRPRRFGKTLTMSMIEQFFSVKYARRSDLFRGLQIWEDEKYRKLQGIYFLEKENLCHIWSFLLASGYLKIVSVDDSAIKRSFLGKVKYELALTSGEIQIMCASLIRG